MSLTRLGCMYMKKACCERYNKLFSLKLMKYNIDLKTAFLMEVIIRA